MKEYTIITAAVLAFSYNKSLWLTIITRLLWKLVVFFDDRFKPTTMSPSGLFSFRFIFLLENEFFLLYLVIAVTVLSVLCQKCGKRFMR